MSRKDSYSRLKAVLVWSIAVLLLMFGCQRRSTGKFNDEEIAEIGFSERTNPTAYSGGLALAAAGEVITVDEVAGPLGVALGPEAAGRDFEEFRQYARPEVERFVKSKISEQILYRQARKAVQGDIDEALDKAAEKEVQVFVAEYGGNYAEAEKKLKEDGLNWKSFREFRKKLILTQSYLAKEFEDNRPIMYNELRDYYEKVKDKYYAVGAALRFRLIDIQPGQLAKADGADAEDKARELAEELVERINGGEDFGELAKEYSHGIYASNGGFWDPPPQPGSLAEPYDAIEAMCATLEPGQTAGPIETAGHIFIVRLEGKQAQGFRPFGEVQADAEQRLLVERRMDKINKLLAKLAGQTESADVDSFIDACVRRIYEEQQR